MNELKLKQCFADGLGIKIDDVVDELEVFSIPQWDSLGHMALIAELESVFGIKFEADDIIAINTVAQTRSILEKYGESFDDAGTELAPRQS